MASSEWIFLHIMSFLQKCLSTVAQGKRRKIKTQPLGGFMRSCCAALLARFESGEVLTSGQTKQQRDYGLPTGKESLTDWKLTDQFEVPLVMTFTNEFALLSACCREVESFQSLGFGLEQPHGIHVVHVIVSLFLTGRHRWDPLACKHITWNSSWLSH